MDIYLKYVDIYLKYVDICHTNVGINIYKKMCLKKYLETVDHF